MHVKKKNNNTFPELTSLASPSLAHARPLGTYLFWLCRFFCPPSANLHSSGSVGATGKQMQRD